ncbi:MAG: hypothetical protein WAU56_04970 [Steroidobacteraceae bacterium]
MSATACMRAGLAASAALLAAQLAGCATGFKADAPAGVSLAGTWRLDHAKSDDPQVVINTMRTEALKQMQKLGLAQERALAQIDTARGAGGAGPVQSGEQVFSPDQSSPRADLLRRSPMRHVLAEAIERGDFLTVRQSSDELVLDYGSSVRSFTPGGRSVVSAENGVADRTSGWKAHQYVIRDKAQMGPSVVETYELSPDGQHLVETLHIGPYELPAIELKRVYDRAEAAPRQPPNTD